MARYELGERFWTIGRDGAEGKTLVTSTGKVGNKGKQHTRTYPNAGAATAHYDDLVLEKIRGGYKLVEGTALAGAVIVAPPVVDAAAAALEAAIIADATDTAAYTVYADWLQQQGDPRGELITLMLAREAELARDTGAKRRSALPMAIARHMERHAHVLFGPLASHVPDVRDPTSGPFTWRAGFIHSLMFKKREAAAIVRDVLAHPSGRFLRELILEPPGFPDAQAVIDVLCDRAPPTLAELDLSVKGTGEDQLDVTPLWAALPGLRRINLAAQNFDLGAVDAPAVKRARFAAKRLSVASVRSIAAAPWPALQWLELRFGGRYDASSSTIDDLQPLLVRGDLPALTHLKLRGCAYAGEALAVLADGPLARQLVVADLSHGHVEREDIRALIRHRADFPALRELWLPSFCIAEAQRALAGIAKHVISDERSALDVF